MQKYEYLVINVGGSLTESTKILSIYGSEGYRLVATELSMGYTMRYVLERPIEEPAAATRDLER